MTADIKQAEKIARESADLARKSLRKSNELQAYLSLLEHKAGRVREHVSVRALVRKLKKA